MATLRELAERTGYSPATISRILTGDPALAVSEEARKRVLEEAGRLNYAATKSRRGRSPKHLLRVAVAEMLTPDAAVICAADMLVEKYTPCEMVIAAISAMTAVNDSTSIEP